MATIGIATGAGRGMGYVCAQRLATMVDHLVLVDLDEALVRTVAGGALRSRDRGVRALRPRRHRRGRTRSPRRPGRGHRDAPRPSPTPPASPRPWPTGAASSGSTSWGPLPWRKPCCSAGHRGDRDGVLRVHGSAVRRRRPAPGHQRSVGRAPPRAVPRPAPRRARPRHRGPRRGVRMGQAGRQALREARNGTARARRCPHLLGVAGDDRHTARPPGSRAALDHAGARAADAARSRGPPRRGRGRRRCSCSRTKPAGSTASTCSSTAA